MNISCPIVRVHINCHVTCHAPLRKDFTPPRLCYQPDKAHGSDRVGAPVICYGEWWRGAVTCLSSPPCCNERKLRLQCSSGPKRLVSVVMVG